MFVCTANICRSPTAELLARSRFGEEKALFRSAGFLRDGKEVPDTLQAVLGERGTVASQHLSSTIDPDTLDAADLILTMEGRHIQELTIKHQSALGKALPLKEAAERMRRAGSIEDLLAGLDSRNLADYLGTTWDVDDPYKRGKRRYKKMVAEVDELLGQVIAPLLR